MGVRNIKGIGDNMKYGVGTSIGNYEMLSDLGFDYIELAGNQIAKMTEEEFAVVQKTIAEGSVNCCGFNAALPPEIILCGEGYDLDLAKEYAENLCKRGSLLGITAIGIGSPNSRKYKNDDSLELAWKQVEDFLSMFADVAAQYNIIVMYESLNHTESQFGLRIREGAELIERLGKDNLKLVFDIYHMHMEQESLEEVKAALPYIHHVHIAERVGTERRYPTKDLYDYYKNAIGLVMEYGYDNAICTEAFDGDVYEGAKRSISLLKEIVADVKGV